MQLPPKKIQTKVFLEIFTLQKSVYAKVVGTIFVYNVYTNYFPEALTEKEIF